jgi:hypothetical protein
MTRRRQGTCGGTGSPSAFLTADEAVVFFFEFPLPLWLDSPMGTLRGNALLAKSGGPTAVSNPRRGRVIHEALRHGAAGGRPRSAPRTLGIIYENIFDLCVKSAVTPADYVPRLNEQALRTKTRYNKSGTIQRNVMHFASQTDCEEAYRCGRQVVGQAVDETRSFMLGLAREDGGPGHSRAGMTPLGPGAIRRKGPPAKECQRCKDAQNTRPAQATRPAHPRRSSDPDRPGRRPRIGSVVEAARSGETVGIPSKWQSMTRRELFLSYSLPRVGITTWA